MDGTGNGKQRYAGLGVTEANQLWDYNLRVPSLIGCPMRLIVCRESSFGCKMSSMRDQEVPGTLQACSAFDGRLFGD